ITEQGARFLARTLVWLCSLAVWSSSAAQDESIPHNCSSQAGNLPAALKEAIDCGENLPWSSQQTAALLLSVRNLTDSLHKHQLRECQGAEPEKCPPAEVPDNGGLVCVTVANKRYCKPLCNDGYDFAFIRRSRLYDVCSERNITGHPEYRWDSQYVGGNKLAECNKASFQVSGAKTAYFTKDQDCLTTKSSSRLQDAVVEGFKAELEKEGVQGEARYACLVCGGQ
uniref:Si:ch1073-126c3.2 n=1 Tax=Sparus aurata TaxID=8175 RepID=A0A671X673_SPAAU